FLAAYLREKREVLAQGRLKDLGPLLLIWGGTMLVLVATNDMGSGILYFGVFLAMLYIATARVSYVAAGVALLLAGAFFAARRLPHIHERVQTWLNPWPHLHSTGYQTVQGLYSIASGSWLGSGLGKGTFTTTDGHQ